MKPFRLDDQHRMIHDNHSYVIQEWVAFTKPGAKSPGKWRSLGYFSSFHALLRGFVDVQVSKSPHDLVSALRHAVARVSTVSRELQDAVDEAVASVATPEGGQAAEQGPEAQYGAH